MVHTTFNSEYHFGKRSSRQVELSSNLYQVVINGEDGEYIEYEIEADSHSEASRKVDALVATKMNVSSIVVHSLMRVWNG